MAPPSIHRDGTGGTNTTQNNQSRGDRNSYYGTRDNNTNNNNNNDSTSSGGGMNRNRSSSITSNSNSNSNSKEHHLSPEQLQNKIFVGGLPLHLNKDELRDYFSKFGNVVDAIIMMDMNQQRSRGFGFVTFENGSGGAQSALAAQPLYIGEKYVEIKLATPKGDRDRDHNNNNNNSHNKSKYHHQNNNNNHAQAGLRNAAAASMAAYQSKGEFAGLAASYGRSGWRAGYGTIAFGSSGWAVKGWEDISKAPEHSGFSFDLVENAKLRKEGGRKKRGAVKGVEMRDVKRLRKSS